MESSSETKQLTYGYYIYTNKRKLLCNKTPNPYHCHFLEVHYCLPWMNPCFEMFPHFVHFCSLCFCFPFQTFQIPLAIFLCKWSLLKLDSTFQMMKEFLQYVNHRISKITSQQHQLSIQSHFFTDSTFLNDTEILWFLFNVCKERANTNRHSNMTLILCNRVL